MKTDHTRRNNTESMTHIELSIHKLMEEIELIEGADRRLTEAQIHLIQAKSYIGDFVDNVDSFSDFREDDV